MNLINYSMTNDKEKAPDKRKEEQKEAHDGDWEYKLLKKDPFLSENTIEKFFKRVEKTDSCWLWTSSLTKFGYGSFYVDGKYYRAHRISYQIHNGSTSNRHVLHTCDNRKCVNPAHLFLGTNQDNVADRNKKNRQARGSRHQAAILKEKDAIEIRKSNQSTKELSVKYGVAIRTINDVKSGTTWKHILNHTKP